MLEPESESTPPRRDTIDAIRAEMKYTSASVSPSAMGMVTGEPVMLVEGYRFVEQDGQRLSLWSSMLLGLTILICFRSLRWMLICVGVVQLALLLTKASLHLLELRLSMVSSMLTAVVTVVGVATVVHIIVRFRDASQRGKGRLPFRPFDENAGPFVGQTFYGKRTGARHGFPRGWTLFQLIL